MSTPAIETIGLTKYYPRGFRRGRTEALVDLNLEIRRGEIFGFLGPNGAGKTTTIKLLMGFIYPSSGTGKLLGQPIGNVSAHRRIGYMPENPCFHDFLTGRQALLFYGSLFGMGKKQSQVRIDALKELLGLRDELTTPLAKHSKGMLQRVGLAQALINDPELLVLDEPMSGLDPIGRKELRDTIASLRTQGKTVFFSSHILADVELLCDRMSILVGGRMVRVLDVAEFMRTGRKWVVEYTGAAGVAKEFPGAEAEAPTEGPAVLRLGTPEDRDRAVSAVTAAGGRIVSVSEAAERLEDLFVREVRSHRKGGDAA